MPSEIYPLVQYIQYLGILLFAGGAIATMAATDLKIRQRAAYFAAAPGFMMAWGGGHLATDHLAHELFTPWHVGAFLCLVASMNLVHWSVAGEDRKSTPVSAAIAATFVVAVVLATFKPHPF